MFPPYSHLFLLLDTDTKIVLFLLLTSLLLTPRPPPPSWRSAHPYYDHIQGEPDRLVVLVLKSLVLFSSELVRHRSRNEFVNTVCVTWPFFTRFFFDIFFEDIFSIVLIPGCLSYEPGKKFLLQEESPKSCRHKRDQTRDKTTDVSLLIESERTKTSLFS